MAFILIYFTPNSYIALLMIQSQVSPIVFSLYKDMMLKLHIFVTLGNQSTIFMKYSVQKHALFTLISLWFIMYC